MPAVSVVIPNLHSPLIGQVVEALEQQTVRQQICEIIVVGQDRYNLLPATVQWIVTPRPMGAAAARNLGARRAQGAYILFLDADCIAAPDLIERLLERHTQGEAVVGGSVAFETENYWSACDNLLVFTPFLATAPAGSRRYLPSLNLSIARTVFLACNGFDEQFPAAAGEDIDLSLRLRAQGYRLFFEPQAVVLHRPQRLSARSIWQHTRNFGRVHVRLQQTYDGRAAPRLSLRMRPWAGFILALAPLLALGDVLRMYQVHAPLRRYWRMLPGMVWGKTAWYWGVVEMLLMKPEEII